MIIAKKTDGFSLVELMASMVVMAIISMNLATMVKNQDAATFKTMAEYDMAQATSEIGTYLADPDFCRYYMTGTLPGASSATPSAFILSNAAGPPAPFVSSNSTLSTPNLSVTLSQFTASNAGNKETAPLLGNSNIGIESFRISSWAGPAGTIDSLAKFEIRFFKKGASAASTISKTLNMIVTTDATSHITTCRTVGFLDKSFSSGINACPSGTSNTVQDMIMIGTPKMRGTFCISKTAPTTNDFITASRACLAITDPKLGSAHLCDFDEWNIACLSNTATGSTLPALGLTIGNGTPEWIGNSPVSNATSTTASPPDATTEASKVVQIGADITATPPFDRCITASIVAPTTPTAYRCCFH